MKIPFAHNTILILAPHADDAELGCGGTISRLLEEGKHVHIAVFSTARASLPPGSPPDRLEREFRVASKALGISEENLHLFDYPVRVLDTHRQDILENLIMLRRQVAPDLVLLPSGNDLHQDHQVLYNEGLRAFKEVSVWGYELPWNLITFSSQAVVHLDRSHIEKKWSALQAYHSQIELKRAYFTWEFVEGLAKLRGTQVKADYAEAFEVYRIQF